MKKFIHKLLDINPMAAMMVITTAVMCMLWIMMYRCVVSKKSETKIEVLKSKSK